MPLDESTVHPEVREHIAKLRMRRLKEGHSFYDHQPLEEQYQIPGVSSYPTYD